jgi:hypothetical protein
MSLKFGIYLLEHRVISPEQFCGLVKIQQDTTLSLPNIAIRNNLMTIKQVARVLSAQESQPGRSFIEVALQENLIDSHDVQRLLHEQQQSSPSIQRLLVECGLLNEHQTEVLFRNFEKLAARGLYQQLSLARDPVADQPEIDRSVAGTEVTFLPPQPKFSQRPIVVQPVAEPG